MKKNRLTYFFMVISFLALFVSGQACYSMPPSASPLEIPFNVQAVRVHSFRHQPVTVISSVNELERHYNIENLRSQTGVLSRNDRLFNTLVKYNDDYFAENFLVIAAFIESSGSIRHEVERIDPNGNIVIRRFTPQVGTADMAAWNIFIEINNNNKAEEYKIEILNTRRE